MIAELLGSARGRARLFDVSAFAGCACAVALVYGQTRDFGFVNFDDPGYVTQNAAVRSGLNASSIGWAFSSLQEGHYHPLTWLSHMAVVQVFGLPPAAHHLTNVALHALNAALLYLLFARATGQRWHALVAALLFAVHPLRSESVAWITERKDVLSSLFWLASSLCYLGFVRSGGALRWIGALVFYALGLLAKPMVITLPAALLLLDHWPLRRIAWDDFGHWKQQIPQPLREKLALLTLAAGSALLTIYGQRQAGALSSAAEWTPSARLANASVGYVAYLGQWLWPSGTSIFHPLRPLPAGLGVACALALGMFTILVWRARERAPALLCGWLWFLGTFLPVIGLLQVGGQARADRFTYVPSIGLGIMLVWGLPQWLGPHFARSHARVRYVATGLLLVGLAVWARQDARRFADSETLWRHALAADSDNFMAHNNLGVELDAQGRYDESEQHFRESVRLNPGYPPARTNLGNALARRGDYAGAVAHFELALQRQPQLTEAHYNLGLTLARLGRYEEAARHYRDALRLTPSYAVAHYSLGALLLGLGQRAEGLGHLRDAIALQPQWREPRAFLERQSGAP